MALTPGISVPRLSVAFLCGVVCASLVVNSAQAQDPCEDPRNLTYNCQFDRFSPAPGGEVPEGWWPFVVSGHPAFDLASDTPRYPALRIWSDGEPFVAGIYQEVQGVVPGATYEAFIGWAVFQSQGSQMGRSIGIDPTGGTDPQSSRIIWSEEVWEKKRSNPELRVRAVAQSDKLTVFVRVDHPRTYGADEAFLDAVSLVRDEAVPVVLPATATATATVVPIQTPVPSTNTPAPTVVLPTETATVLAATATSDRARHIVGAVTEGWSELPERTEGTLGNATPHAETAHVGSPVVHASSPTAMGVQPVVTAITAASAGLQTSRLEGDLPLARKAVSGRGDVRYLWGALACFLSALACLGGAEYARRGRQ